MSAFSAVYGELPTEYDATNKTIEDVIAELKVIRVERDVLLVQNKHTMDTLTQCRSKINALEATIESFATSKMDAAISGLNDLMTENVSPMRLSTVIQILREADPDKIISPAFDDADSYRGSYDQLAFSPCASNTVKDMLRIAQNAMDCCFTGYKGGEYFMDGDTKCVIASYGTCSLDNQDKIRLYAVMQDVKAK